MLVSELGSCANLHTQAETPATRLTCRSSPLRQKNRQSYDNLTALFDSEARSSIVTGSRGRVPKANGERFSYALGDGNYLLLEEVDEASAHKLSPASLLQARDVTIDYMAVENQSPFKIAHHSAAFTPNKILTPGQEFRHSNLREENVTIKPRNDIREQGPLSREYAKRFMKHHTQLTVPKQPVKMEWFEEDEMARAIYEMMMAETDLEILKRQLALASDFNVEDCWRMFDLSNTG